MRVRTSTTFLAVTVVLTLIAAATTRSAAEELAADDLRAAVGAAWPFFCNTAPWNGSIPGHSTTCEGPYGMSLPSCTINGVLHEDPCKICHHPSKADCGICNCEPDVFSTCSQGITSGVFCDCGWVYRGICNYAFCENLTATSIKCNAFINTCCGN